MKLENYEGIVAPGYNSIYTVDEAGGIRVILVARARIMFIVNASRRLPFHSRVRLRTGFSLLADTLSSALIVSKLCIMRIADVIIKKRDGEELTNEEIQFFIKELVDGRLESSQLGILIKFHGLGLEQSQKFCFTMSEDGYTLIG